MRFVSWAWQFAVGKNESIIELIPSGTEYISLASCDLISSLNIFSYKVVLKASIAFSWFLLYTDNGTKVFGKPLYATDREEKLAFKISLLLIIDLSWSALRPTEFAVKSCVSKYV